MTVKAVGVPPACGWPLSSRGAFGTTKAATVTTSRLEQYVADRRDEDAAYASIKYECACSVEHSASPQEPSAGGRASVPDDSRGQRAEGVLHAGGARAALMQQLPGDVADVVTFAACTGMARAV